MSARKGRRAAGALVALSLAAASPAAAQGVPVYDASSVAQAIQQVQQGVEMIARAQATIDAITGARGIGSLMNAPRDIAERASAQQLSGLVDGAITGSEVLGNTARLVQTIERLKGNLDLDDLGTYASSDLVQDRALSVLGGTSLAAMATGEDSYTRANEAMTRVNQLIPQIDANTDLKAAIDDLNADPACTGYIVQLPLPRHLDENAALERIHPDKDADGLHPINLGRLVLGKESTLPCTPRGVIHLLRRYDVPIAGARVTVVGRGVTIGRPIGLLLTRRSENATVTLCHTGTRDLPAEVSRADIVIAAAGVGHLITADMVKPGAAVVDVGVSRDENGKLVGDVHPDVWEVAGHVSPNPGGVGPLTRAFLLANVVERAEAMLAAQTSGVGAGEGGR